MLKTASQETEIQKIQRKHMALESLYKSLESKIESTNRHGCLLTDEIETIKKDYVFLIKSLAIKLDKHVASLEEKIKVIEDRIDKHSMKISEFEEKVQAPEEEELIEK